MATSKKRGIKSSAQDNFLEPSAPTIGTLTNVGTDRPFDNGAATITFTPAASGAAATEYRVYNAADDSQLATGASSPITVTNRSSNSTLSVYVKAWNAVGGSPKSGNSNIVTITTVTSTPSAPSASSSTPSGVPANTAGPTTDSVSWSAPSNNGGSPVDLYEWQSTDSKGTTTASLSVTVSQEGGTNQQYRVRARNGNGWSDWSNYSSSVTTFSFTPYSFTPFGFTPFAFTPVYTFVPYGFVPVYTFVPYGFVPVYTFVPYGFVPVYSFTPYGFVPVYSFTPFGFTPFGFTPQFSFTPFSFIPAPAFSFTPFGFTPAPPSYSFTPAPSGGGGYSFAPWFYG
jgi:hypothetical protein